MEKLYETNDELIKLIISKGWYEITPNIKKGKKLFKKSLKSKGEIYFNYINIQFNYNSFHSDYSRVTENEIDYFINYCSNPYLRMKLKRENINSLYEIKIFKENLEKEIAFYSRFPSQQLQIKIWKRTLRELTFRN